MFLRRATQAASLIIAVCAGGVASAASISVPVSVQSVKPVDFTKVQDLDFGMLTPSGLPGPRTVRISQDGIIVCPAGILCTGTPKAARFNVQGANRSFIQITVVATSLSNGSDTLAFTPDAPPSVTLTNSGNPGTDFGVGGALTVSPSAGGGLYTGTMTVTVDNI